MGCQGPLVTAWAKPAVQYNVDGFPEDHKAAIAPTFMGSSNLHKSSRIQYVIQSCEPLLETCFLIELQP